MNNKMKRTVFLLLAAMLTTALIKAQVTPMVLGDSHAMLKMEQNKKYISWRQTSEGCCGRVRLLEGYKVLQHLRHHQP